MKPRTSRYGTADSFLCKNAKMPLSSAGAFPTEAWASSRTRSAYAGRPLWWASRYCAKLEVNCALTTGFVQSPTWRSASFLFLPVPWRKRTRVVISSGVFFFAIPRMWPLRDHRPWLRQRRRQGDLRPAAHCRRCCCRTHLRQNC